MSDNHNSALRIVKILLEQRRGDGPLAQEAIGEEVDRALTLNPAWRVELDREALIRDVEVQFSVYAGRAALLTARDEHRSWLAARRVEWRFWGRYRETLEDSWPPSSVDELDRITDRTLDLIGDPLRLDGFDRRGLIAGDVQAGKTSNYNGLICKASDAGYKVIIVLAGFTTVFVVRRNCVSTKDFWDTTASQCKATMLGGGGWSAWDCGTRIRKSELTQ